MTTAIYWAASDAATLIGRSVRHSVRSVDAMITAIVLPVMLLLLFVYVFGGAISTGQQYIDYVVPGIILLCAGFGSASTAVGVAQDMTTGVTDRFRTLDIVSSSVITGHVAASILRNVVSTSIVLVLALVLGFDPSGGVLDWLAVLGVLLLFMGAISWLAAAFGLVAKSMETAGAFSFVVMFLPYLSSAFVPTVTMPGVLQDVATRQPITPVIETLRALMMGTPGGDAATAVAWCGGGILVGVAASAALLRRRTAG